MKNTYFKKIPFLILLVFTVFLVACGKGESTDTGNPVKSNFSGVASKGVIVGGVVKIFSIDNNGVISTKAIEKTITDGTGAYRTNVATGGIFLVTVSPALDGSSKVKCDVHTGCTQNAMDYDFGDLMPMNFTLEAFVQGSGSIDVNLTPMTHLAAAYARHIGVSKTSIEHANSRVSKLFGIADIIKTKPTDITNDAAIENAASTVDEVKYGYFNAAIANLAQSETTGDIAAILQVLVESYIAEHGELVANEAVSNSTQVSLAEITEAAKTEVQASDNQGVTNKTAVKDDIESLDNAADSATAGEPTQTQIEPITSADIQTAKQMVTAVRTWTPKLQAELGQTAESFGQKLEDSMEFGQGGMADVGEVFFRAAQAMAELYLDQMQDGGLVDGDYPINDIIGFQDEYEMISATGNINISGNMLSISGGEITVYYYYNESVESAAATVDLALTVPTTTSGTDFNFAFSGTNKVENNLAKLYFDSGALNVKWNTAVDFSNPNIEPPMPSQVSASIKGGIEQKATEVNTNPIRFSGEAVLGTTYISEFSYERYDGYSGYMPDSELNFAPSKITLSGELADNSNSITATAEFNFRNAATFQFPAHIKAPMERTVGHYGFSNNGNTITLNFDNGAIKVYQLLINENSSFKTVRVTSISEFDDTPYVYESTIYGATTLESFVLNNGFYRYIHIDGVGDYQVVKPDSLTSNGGNILGTLEWEDYATQEDATHWRKMDGTLIVSVDFEDLPPASITLTADRTGYSSFNANASFVYKEYKIEVQFNMKDFQTNPVDADMAIIVTEIASGNRLSIHPNINSDDFIGNVKVNNNIVGVLKPDDNLDDVLIMQYQDGSFESINF
ncbi:MAG: hypothetical protein OEZ58_06690 [Gammaproteobacteria bacterium]|nr:hypothetical protein [Gammaproteobacteria bacterium]MDH5728659.1 hypothetical protein [Gammaproteobacteria bacterium]